MDTIYALASARGRAGVAVVRLSGPAAFAAVQTLCGTLPPLRRASLRRLVWLGEELDQALVLVFGAGASFTGEDVAELHLHGSAAIISAVLRALGVQPGLRLAEAGEFTRRALENGCLDLTQVEGLADLLNAETEAQRRQAQRVLSGAIGRHVEAWRIALIRAAALTEATIDFADEDVPVDVSPEVGAIISNLLRDLRFHLSGIGMAERIRDGFEVAIVGAPNVGKSTLLNALAGREAAITSDVAGTTRDVIEVRMDIGGLAVTLLDTAGLRDTNDRVEQIGIDRALQRAQSADLRVILSEPGQPLPPVAIGPEDLILIAKADLLSENSPGVSGLTGKGVTDLLSSIGDRLSQRSAGAGTMTAERHRLALMRAIRALESAQDRVRQGGEGAEFVAADLRVAQRALESLLGRIDVEMLLDEIFSSFCIGK